MSTTFFKKNKRRISTPIISIIKYYLEVFYKKFITLNIIIHLLQYANYFLNKKQPLTVPLLAKYKMGKTLANKTTSRVEGRGGTSSYYKVVTK